MITVSFISHSVFIIYRFSCLYAQKHVMGFPVFLPYIMYVIGTDKRYTGFLAHFHEGCVYGLLLRNSVILQFQIKIAFSKYIKIFESHILCHIIGTVQKCSGNRSSQAGTCGDKSFMILSQKFFIDPWFIVKTFRISKGYKLYQILITFIIFCQQNEMVIAHALPAVFIKTALRGNIYLTADYRLYSFFFACFIKVNNPKHCSMVGYCQIFHSKLRSSFYKLTYFR